MSTDPPTQNTIQFHRSWPPVTVSKEPMRKRDHSQMFVLMVLTTVAAVAAPNVPPAFGIISAFVAGYALCNWQVFEDAYDAEVSE
jgi:hypothetical protein